MRNHLRLCAFALASLAATASFALDASPPGQAGGAPAPAAASKLPPSDATTPTPPAPHGPIATPETATARKARSEECYRQADAKGLQGKDRKAFHRTCLKSE